MMRFKLGLLFFVEIVSANFAAKFNLARGPPKQSIFEHLLDQYRHLNMIMHIDNETKDIADNYLSLHHSMTIIYNHDTTNSEKLMRPLGRNSLNFIMFKQPVRFSKYLKNSENIKPGDIVLFMTRKASFELFLKSYLRIPNLKKGGRVVVVSFMGSIDVYTMCFYCGKSSGILTYSQNISFGNELIKSDKLFADDFRNLHQHVLKVAYINYFPYIYCLKSQRISNVTFCMDATGLEYQLLLSTSRKLNFTFQLIEIQNQSYKTLIDGLVNGLYDLAIGGLSVTPPRLQKLQFGNIIRFEKIILSFSNFFFFKSSFFLIMGDFLGVALLSLTILVAIMAFFILKCNNNSNISLITLFFV